MTARGLFLNAPEHRKVAPGEVIYAEGDIGEQMYGIVDGSVELCKGHARSRPSVPAMCSGKGR